MYQIVLRPALDAPLLPYTRFFPPGIMRFLFLLILLVNVAVLAYGQGFMGTPPSEEGRTPRQLLERNQHIVEFGQPRLAEAQASG